jgi:hypothetical protein
MDGQEPCPGQLRLSLKPALKQPWEIGTPLLIPPSGTRSRPDSVKATLCSPLSTTSHPPIHSYFERRLGDLYAGKHAPAIGSTFRGLVQAVHKIEGKRFVAGYSGHLCLTPRSIHHFAGDQNSSHAEARRHNQQKSARYGRVL